MRLNAGDKVRALGCDSSQSVPFDLPIGFVPVRPLPIVPSNVRESKARAKIFCRPEAEQSSSSSSQSAEQQSASPLLPQNSIA